MNQSVASDEGVDLRASRILICDDSDVERGGLNAYLRSRGYDTRQASEGKEALREIKTHEFDLILLDLHMPGTSGFDVLAYLQEHRRGLPVIVMSGLPVDEIQSNIHSLPQPELPPLVLKPIDVDKLVPLMELVLSEQLPDFEAAGPGLDDESESSGSPA